MRRGRSRSSASPTATLPGHVESGEERFLTEWDRSDDAVWFDIDPVGERRVLARDFGSRDWPDA